MTLHLPLLVVDDREADRQLMILTLAVAFPEAEVLVAVDPREALQMCAAQAFECVLTDYDMGDMNGVTMASQLRSAHPHLPIILMTSVGDEMLAVEAMRSGVSDYTPKSRITAESVRRIVERSIHGCAQQRVIDQQRDELETFAYALAHDFKQPIRQITIFSQMIAEQLADHDAGDVQQHLTFLQGAAGRLAKLVDIMSQYTLLNQPPALGKVDLNVVIASVRASLGPYLADRGADFAFPLDAPMVHGNETLMTQIVQNLVMNGLHYNRSLSPRVELIARAAPDGYIIEITDNGIGIEAEYLGEIFKPLVRLHNSSEFPGSGLGLALTKRAVLSQGGHIWCESELGQGSVFSVRLPATS